jgi:outer membrane autotransporter protein
MDTETNLHKDLIIGAAFAYAFTGIDSDNYNDTQTDINTYQLSAYGEYAVGKDYFLSANLSLAYNEIDTLRKNVGIARDTATADFGSMQYGASFAFGKDFRLFTPGSKTGIILTPRVTADYLLVDVDNYSETGAGGVSLDNVSTETYARLDLGVLLDAEWNIETSRGSIVNPSFHAGYKYDIIQDDIDVSSNFTGGGPSFDTDGIKPDEHTFNFGTGLGYDTLEKWSVNAEYDYEFKEDFHAHAGKVRVKYKY